MAFQTRTLIVAAVMSGIALFVIGIVIGHFAIRREAEVAASPALSGLSQVADRCVNTAFPNSTNTAYKDSYVQGCLVESCYEDVDDCNELELPRTYIAYHLGNKQITIDGSLDEEAWTEVPWTEDFVDIRGNDYPAPYFASRVKVRWDDSRLYVAAWMEETDFWGTLTQDESLVWTENAFEVYAVPDGSMHNYKEMEISVKNVTWDLMLTTTYLDRPPCTEEEFVRVRNWTSNMVKYTSTDGTYNDPNAPKGTHWIAEWSFTFEALAEDTDRPVGQATPSVNEAWFMIFARPEYKFRIIGNKYQKDTSAETDWWVWQPTYTVNLHIPNRFGLVQFKRDLTDKRFYYDRWHIYKALFDVFEAEHSYKSLNGMFISELKKLSVPPRVVSGKCVDIMLTSNGTDFTVKAKSRINSNLPTGNIRADRYVWFT